MTGFVTPKFQSGIVTPKFQSGIVTPKFQSVNDWYSDTLNVCWVLRVLLMSDTLLVTLVLLALCFLLPPPLDDGEDAVGTPRGQQWQAGR